MDNIIVDCFLTLSVDGVMSDELTNDNDEVGKK